MSTTDQTPDPQPALADCERRTATTVDDIVQAVVLGLPRSVAERAGLTMTASERAELEVRLDQLEAPRITVHSEPPGSIASGGIVHPDQTCADRIRRDTAEILRLHEELRQERMRSSSAEAERLKPDPIRVEALHAAAEAWRHAPHSDADLLRTAKAFDAFLRGNL